MEEKVLLRPKNNDPTININTVKIIGCLNGEQVLEYQTIANNDDHTTYNNTQIVSLTNEEIFMY